MQEVAHGREIADRREVGERLVHLRSRVEQGRQDRRPGKGQLALVEFIEDSLDDAIRPVPAARAPLTREAVRAVAGHRYAGACRGMVLTAGFSPRVVGKEPQLRAGGTHFLHF